MVITARKKPIEIQAKQFNGQNFNEIVAFTASGLTQTARDVDTMTGPDWKVTWKSVNNTKLDSKAFKTDHADLYAAYSKTSTTRRFVLA